MLEAGYTIWVGVVERASVGIDTPADYAAFVERRTKELAGNMRNWTRMKDEESLATDRH